MRILLSCLQDLQPHAIPAYRFWADYFRHGIREAGHEVAEVPDVDWAAGITPLSEEELARWKSATWGRTLDYVTRARTAGRPIELFLSYLYPAQVEPAALAEIRRLGIPCVNFFCDNVREFKKVPAVYRSFDLHWVPEFEAVPMYRSARLKHFHAPMPVWIAPENRNAPDKEGGEAVFIGSEDDLRRQLLGEAIRRGVRIKIGGSGWRETGVKGPPSTIPGSWQHTLHRQMRFIRQRGLAEWSRKIVRVMAPPRPIHLEDEIILPPISNQEYVRLTRESPVVIGINRVPTFRRSLKNPLTYSRLRDIEAPMLGACYLTEWTEGLAQLYDLGTEIETYRTAEELATKVEQLLGDANKRRRLRQLGQERALNHLTLAKSLEKMCAALA